MKALILAAALASPVAAQTLVQDNEAGGKIVLTNRACVVDGKTYDKLRSAFAYAADKSVVVGCWLWRGTEVRVVWATSPQPTFKTYRLSAFQGSE